MFMHHICRIYNVSSLKKLSGPLDTLFRLKHTPRLHLFTIRSEWLLSNYPKTILRHIFWCPNFVTNVKTWRSIRVITKLPNTEQSPKGKIKTHKSTNRQNQSTTGKLGNRNGPDLVQEFLKKWWIESDFTAPNLSLSLRFKGSGCHYNSIYYNTGTK